MRKSLTAAVLLAAAALAVPASAAPAGAGERHTATVSYADLDLGSPAGRAALDRRIRFAVKQVCAVGRSREPAAQLNAAVCARDAMRRASAEVAVALAAAPGRAS